MLAKSLLAAAAFVASVSAQAATSTVPQAMPPTATAGFNPALVNTGNRTEWCRGQRNVCIILCDVGNGGGTSMNDCEEQTLTYNCACYNGTAPDVSPYEQSLPAFICRATRGQCIANANSDPEREDDCDAAAQCGTQDVNTLDANNTESATTTSSSAPTGNPTSSSTPSPTQSPNMASPFSQEVGAGAFAAVLMAVFGLFL